MINFRDQKMWFGGLGFAAALFIVAALYLDASSLSLTTDDAAQDSESVLAQKSSRDQVKHALKGWNDIQSHNALLPETQATKTAGASCHNLAQCLFAAIQKDTFPARVHQLTSKALLSAAEQEELQNLFDNPQNINEAFARLSIPSHNLDEEEKAVRFLQLHFLRAVSHTQDSGVRSLLLDEAEASLLAPLPESLVSMDMRKLVGVEKAEIYEIIRNLDPKRAEGIKREATDRTLSKIIAFAEKVLPKD